MIWFNQINMKFANECLEQKNDTFCLVIEPSTNTSFRTTTSLAKGVCIMSLWWIINSCTAAFTVVLRLLPVLWRWCPQNDAFFASSFDLTLLGFYNQQQVLRGGTLNVFDNWLAYWVLHFLRLGIVSTSIALSISFAVGSASIVFNMMDSIVRLKRIL